MSVNSNVKCLYWQSFYLPIHLYLLSNYLSIYLSIYLPISLSLSISLSLYLCLLLVLQNCVVFGRVASDIITKRSLKLSLKIPNSIRNREQVNRVELIKRIIIDYKISYNYRGFQEKLKFKSAPNIKLLVYIYSKIKKKESLTYIHYVFLCGDKKYDKNSNDLLKLCMSIKVLYFHD